jgi:DivIVA domain-containing protein
MLTSSDAMDRIFTPTSFRRGYDEREVDDFLDQVVEALRYYEQGGRPGPQAPLSPAQPKSGGLAQRATRWLRGDPSS